MADFVRVPETDWQNILDAVRDKTGSTEKMVSSAVASEIASIQSGGSGGVSGIYMAKVTPASNVDEIEVTHNLGTTDILLACCWAETFGDVTPTFDGAVGNTYLRSSVPFMIKASSTDTHKNMITYAKWNTTGSWVATVGQPNAPAYMTTPIDGNRFKFDSAGSAAAKYFAGVTYTVIIIAASAFVEV